MPVFPSVAFGLDCARLSLPPKSCPPNGAPSPDRTIATIPLLSGSADAILQRLAELAEKRHLSLIKLKVARLALSDEIDLVRQILHDYPHLRLRLDANRGWSS